MALTKDEIAFNAAIEQAAKIASPDYHKAKPGAWAGLRIKLANEIRACKIENGSA